jgi:hypothetical protein
MPNVISQLPGCSLFKALSTRRNVRIRYMAVAVAAVCAVVVGLVASPAGRAGASPGGVPLQTIQPGQHAVVHITTPVNLVFVGYQPQAIDVHRILSQMPVQGDPIVRTDQAFGLPATAPDVGLRYHYQYKVQFANSAFDDAFFGYLSSIAIVGPIDHWQLVYNEQQHNDLDVGPTTAYIDANATEAWLEQQSQQRLGIAADEDTVFLVNWYGRADFQFHDYYHLGDIDPATGFDYGRLSESLTRAWGGNSGPTWFYDLSAGPDWDDNSYDVDDAQFANEGVTEYRMPPIWEYGNLTAYRPFNDLSGDLAKVIRYDAIDMLFTPSPIYDPAATVPSPGGDKRIDVDVFEGDPAHDGLSHIVAGTIQNSAEALEPYYGVTVGVTDQPLADGVLDAYNIATGVSTAPGCSDFTTYGPIGFPEAELNCYFRDHRAQYFPAATGDAVIPVSDYTVPQYGFPWIGSTDPDFQTGEPDFITELDVAPPPGFLTLYPLTETTIHETGHFVGLSHPHDGYDSTSGIEFDVFGAFNFAWDSDESATPMSYLPSGGSLTFDRFDRDNMGRWQVARLLDLADTDAAAILSRTHSSQINAQLAQADADFARALAALHRSDWLGAATAAVAGYDQMQQADAAAGVTPASQLLGQTSTAATVGHHAQRTPDQRKTPKTLHLWMPPAGTGQAPVAPTVTMLTGPAT